MHLANPILLVLLLSLTVMTGCGLFPDFGVSNEDLGLPCVHEYEDVVKDPQVKHIEPFLTAEHPVAGKFQVVGHPIKYDGVRPGIRRLPPDLGESTRDMLRSIGYTEEQINALIEKGVVKASD